MLLLLFSCLSAAQPGVTLSLGLSQDVNRTEYLGFSLQFQGWSNVERGARQKAIPNFSACLYFLPKSENKFLNPCRAWPFKAYDSGLKFESIHSPSVAMIESTARTNIIRISEISFPDSACGTPPLFDGSNGRRKIDNVITWELPSDIRTIADCYNFVRNNLSVLRQNRSSGPLAKYVIDGGKSDGSELNCVRAMVLLCESFRFLNPDSVDKPFLSQLHACTSEKSIGYILQSNNHLKELYLNVLYFHDVTNRFALPSVWAKIFTFGIVQGNPLLEQVADILQTNFEKTGLNMPRVRTKIPTVCYDWQGNSENNNATVQRII